VKVPTFNNKPNECVTLADGRTVFLSRSTAVCVAVTALVNGKLYTLVSHRGKGVPNYQYHQNLICGYLDYNETLHEAALREVWEETGFDISSINKGIVYGIQNPPWAISDLPKGKVQNITHRYGFVFKVDSLDDLPTLSNAYSEKDEVITSEWVSHKDLLLLLDNNPEEPEKSWAFNHFFVYREWVSLIKGFVCT